MSKGGSKQYDMTDLADDVNVDLVTDLCNEMAGILNRDAVNPNNAFFAMANLMVQIMASFPKEIEWMQDIMHHTDWRRMAHERRADHRTKNVFDLETVREN